MTQIVDIMTKSLIQRCKLQLNITLSIRNEVKSFIVDKAYDPKFGARPLRRKIQTDMEDALAEEILAGKMKEGDKVTAVVKNDKINFKVSKEVS